MIEYLENMQAWHWLVLAFLLLGAEALGASGFLIGAGLAALLQALISWLMPDIAWQTQLVLFAISSAVFTVAYWRYFKKFNETTDHQQINDRAAHLIGRTITLESDLLAGEGKVQIGDTLWKVTAETNLNKGDRVEVFDSNAMTLRVRLIQD